MMPQSTPITPTWHKIGRMVVRIGLVIGFVVLVKLGLLALFDKIALLENDAAARTMTGLMIAVVIGYAVLLAVPFVPGVEIGLALLMIEGAQIAPFVYLATVMGLLLAFMIGQLAPLDRLIRLCQDLYLYRLGILLERTKSTPRDARITAMETRLPKWLAALLCNYRYVTLGLAINMPGSFVLGGGGGILLAAGISRLFQTGYVALTLAIAVLPIPLIVWVLGYKIPY